MLWLILCRSTLFFLLPNLLKLLNIMRLNIIWWVLNLGCARFAEIWLKYFEFQILWSLSSVDFHTLTLQLSIQTPNSVAPELQVFVSLLAISAKRAHPKKKTWSSGATEFGVWIDNCNVKVWKSTEDKLHKIWNSKYFSQISAKRAHPWVHLQFRQTSTPLSYISRFNSTVILASCLHGRDQWLHGLGAERFHGRLFHIHTKLAMMVLMLTLLYNCSFLHYLYLSKCEARCQFVKRNCLSRLQILLV